jgi:uncharacterized protein YbjQ (UPF0145 family)
VLNSANKIIKIIKEATMKLSLYFTQVIVIISLLAMGACSSTPDALSGNDLSHLSLRDKRMADKSVQVLSVAAEQVGVMLGKVETMRCQNTMFSDVPDEKTLLVDLKAEAYRLGANALANVVIQDDGVMSDGCWKMFKATANMLVIE